LERFKLDTRLANDTIPIANLGLCQLRMMNDKRWPWLVMVPQRAGIAEVFDLTPLDQAMLTFESNLVASALKKTTGCTKINIAAIGNIVRQLHLHVIGRNEGDANWPGPVWGFGTPEPYDDHEKHKHVEEIMRALGA
jgi:diadenosine tetraphosphate (Ap4A) HIT family hydrolase